MPQLSWSTHSRRLIAILLFSVSALTATSSVSAFQTFGTKWGASQTPGTAGGVVTYSYMAGGIRMLGDKGSLSVSLESFMPAGFKLAIEAAFAAWSAVADITFVEVEDGGEAFNAFGVSGDIRIGAYNIDGPYSELAHAYFPPPYGASAAGDIHFDSSDVWDMDLDGSRDGFDVFQVFAHELGHAIGLSHVASRDASALMNPYYQERIVGLQADDIAGAQFLYGPPASGVPDSGSTVLLLGSALAVVMGIRRKLKA